VEGKVRQITRVGNAIAIDEPLCDEPGLGEGEWYYVSISHGDRQMGLLVETGVEDEAWQEAEEFCESFGAPAKVVGVQKIVLQ
jgi:hypothetical protein